MDVYLNPIPCMENLWLISQRESLSGMQKITSKYPVMYLLCFYQTMHGASGICVM